jgi:hypothetical protein
MDDKLKAAIKLPVRYDAKQKVIRDELGSVILELSTVPVFTDAQAAEVDERLDQRGKAIAACINGHERLVRENERLASALQEISDWATKAYPTDVFIEPTKDEWAAIDAHLKAGGFSLSAISGSNMRHVLSSVKGIVADALLNTTEATK